MARIRTVRPELLRHEGLYELEQATGLPIRIAWVGLLTVADREGRFPWRPRTLKLDVLPYDSLDLNEPLNEWLKLGFIVKYRVNESWFGWIPTWSKHQTINHRERASDLPSVDDADEVIDYRNQELKQQCTNRAPHCTGKPGNNSAFSSGEGKGRERSSISVHSPNAPSRKYNDYPGYFEDLWQRLPGRAGSNPKRRAHQALAARLRAGAKLVDIGAGVERYREYCEATGKIATEYVMQGATFLGPEEHYLQAWEIPGEKRDPVWDRVVEELPEGYNAHDPSTWKS